MFRYVLPMVTILCGCAFNESQPRDQSAEPAGDYCIKINQLSQNIINRDPDSLLVLLKTRAVLMDVEHICSNSDAAPSLSIKDSQTLERATEELQQIEHELN